MNKQTKREIATKTVRVYPSTLLALQKLSLATGKTIPRIISESLRSK